MSNMSYCRFQNTSRDFRDCLENLRTLASGDSISQNGMEELAARRDLIQGAVLLLQELGINDIHDDIEVENAIDELDADQPIGNDEDGYV